MEESTITCRFFLSKHLGYDLFTMMEKPGKDRLRFLRRNPEFRHVHLDMSILGEDNATTLDYLSSELRKGIEVKRYVCE